MNSELVRSHSHVVVGVSCLYEVAQSEDGQHVVTILICYSIQFWVLIFYDQGLADCQFYLTCVFIYNIGVVDYQFPEFVSRHAMTFQVVDYPAVRRRQVTRDSPRKGGGGHSDICVFIELTARIWTCKLIYQIGLIYTLFRLSAVIE